jgi:tagaturonate reductase
LLFKSSTVFGYTMKHRILQFGTSRFLQAHADLFVHEAHEAGQDIGPITIVKTTRAAERAGRVAAFGNKAGYEVRIRGLVDGVPLEKSVWVRSIARALDAHLDWALVEQVFITETEIVICNVGEAGYDLAASDVVPGADVPSSFPAKLLRLLIARFHFGGAPLLILPCELISDNGRVLRKILSDLAVTWRVEAGFLVWLKTQVTICSTLVDRIVSEPLEPIGAIAEPYALWAIEANDASIIPFSHPAVIVTDDLTPYLRLKLHILNLGHSFLAQIWLTEKRDEHETVRQILDDAAVLARLNALYAGEVVPGFAAYGMGQVAAAYVATTLERFQNPFLNHRLSDIAQNHGLKIQRRCADFIDWVEMRDATFKMNSLRQLAIALARLP